MRAAATLNEGDKLPGYAVKKIDDMEGIYLGGFKLARAEMGITSFGMPVIDLPAGYGDYPEHEHAEAARRRSTWRFAAR